MLDFIKKEKQVALKFDQNEVKAAVKAIKHGHKKPIISQQMAPIAHKVQKAIENEHHKEHKEKKKLKHQVKKVSQSLQEKKGQSNAKMGKFNSADIDQIMKMSKEGDSTQNLFDNPIFQPQKKYHKIAKKLEKDVPKQAKKHAKKIETALQEEEYFINKNKQ